MAPDIIIRKFQDYFAGETPTRYPKGEILVSPGEVSDKAYFVTSGRIRAYELSYRGEEVVVSIINPPAFFPMSWSVERIPNRFYYKAESDCEVYLVDAEKVVDFMKANTDVLYNQLQRLYSAINGVLGRMVYTMAGTAKSRLLYELVAECRSYGQTQPDGSIHITATERDLASRAGLTRETVSREMSKLKKQGWVEVNGKGIFVRELQQIERALGNEA